jgi:hypothetical protein
VGMSFLSHPRGRAGMGRRSPWPSRSQLCARVADGRMGTKQRRASVEKLRCRRIKTKSCMVMTSCSHNVSIMCINVSSVSYLTVTTQATSAAQNTNERNEEKRSDRWAAIGAGEGSVESGSLIPLQPRRAWASA